MFGTTEIPGMVVIDPDVYRDARGFFLETYHETHYLPHIPERFVQDNHSKSAKGTLRGLHAQSPNPQGKLLRCVSGAIWDVAVDVRLGSPSFGRHVGVELTAENFRQVYVPPGLLHGFAVLSDVAEVEYKCTAFYDRTCEFGVRWDDPELAVAWPIENPTLSDRDRNAPLLSEVRDRLLPYAP